MKNQLPKLLIYSRFIAGLLIVILSYCNISNYKTLAILLLAFGILTDIFDGIIARQLNISTQNLRRMDSATDQVFFICFAIATYIQCPLFFEINVLKLTVLLSAEAMIYLVSFLKFRKEVATHSIGAKAWTLLLVATLVEITIKCQSIMLFTICFWAGILTRLEIIAIIMVLKRWTNDVPSLVHAIKLRKGKEIKRHKMFNG